jgi:hypothetical protein
MTDDHPLTEYFMIRDFYLRSRAAFERVALELALTRHVPGRSPHTRYYARDPLAVEAVTLRS